VRSRFLPRTRLFSERLIERIQNSFGIGMMRQEDTIGVDLPSNALADAINVRCYNGHVEGRPGCYLYSAADFAVTITDNEETLAVAIQSGEIYTANGAVPGVGDVFMVYGDGDTSDNSLNTAKGNSQNPRKYDCFEIINATAGSEAIIYLGNIRNPAVTGYGDTTSTEITASQSGTTITKTAGPDFDLDNVGCYFYWYSLNQRSLITGYTSTTQITVKDSNSRSSCDKNIIQPPQNAILFHRGLNMLIALFGSKLYSAAMPFAGWTEIPRLSYFKPSDFAGSYIFPMDDDAILVNSNGIFQILMSEHRYYWQMNAPAPNTQITDIDQSSNKKFKYHYVFTLSRLTGGIITKDRSDAEEGVVIRHESCPIKPGADNVDWATVWMAEAIGDEATTYGKCVGTALSITYKVPAAYASVNDGKFKVTINGTAYDVSIDFTGVETMTDVAKRLQDAIRVFEDSACQRVIVEYVTDHFVIKTGENDAITAISTSTITGTEMSTHLGLIAATFSSPYYTFNSYSTENGSVAHTLTQPDYHYHSTHYTVYRSRECSNEEIDPHKLVWIADIPVAKAFTASQSGTTITATEGVFEKEDLGSTIEFQDGTERTISGYTDSTHVTVSETGTVTAQSAGIGGGTVFTASQSGTTLTIVSGKTLTSADVGKEIIWADGYTSIIKSVTDGSTAVTAWEFTHVSQGTHIDPVSRKFNDTIRTDVEAEFESRLAAWPLKMRFFEPLPSGDVGAITPGYLFVAIRGGNTYYYCTTADKYLMGYYHPGFQYSDKIWDGVQSMRGKTDRVIIRGASSTYYTATNNFTDVGAAAVGESCAQLSDPALISNVIGSIGDGAVQEIENGAEIIITSEPAIRIFDGAEYGKNMALNKIQKSDLQKMKQAFIGAYQAICGFFFWGKQEK
jgi:hypothetical protein